MFILRVPYISCASNWKYIFTYLPTLLVLFNLLILWYRYREQICIQEFNLGEEPALGMWTIHFSAGNTRETAFFEVIFKFFLIQPIAIVQNIMN
jgi:hypothetical protein